MAALGEDCAATALRRPGPTLCPAPAVIVVVTAWQGVRSDSAASTSRATSPTAGLGTSAAGASNPSSSVRTTSVASPITGG